MLRCGFGTTTLEEEPVIIAEDKVVNLFLNSFDRVLDQPLSLTAICKAILLAGEDVVWLLQGATTGLVLLCLVL